MDNKGINIDAKYITEDELGTWKSKNIGLSVIHFNASSLKKNLINCFFCP